MEGTIYSLIPALLMLVLVLATRKVLLSLGAGVLIGAFMLHDFSLPQTAGEIWLVFRTIFYADGALNTGNLYLLIFLLLLGIVTAFLTASGGSRAFGEWAIRKIKTRKGAQLMPAVLGVIIFIDDYFNSLAVGQIARPLTDRHRISRAKLAYFIDSTSAPITVISPISSWGAYIIGTLGSILAANEMTQYGPLQAFVAMIPLNMYAFAALLLVFLTALFKVDIGLMKTHENRAIETGELTDPERGEVAGDLEKSFVDNERGEIHHLIIPILLLVVATVVFMVGTGVNNTEGQADVLDVFANTDVNLSLFWGGVIAAVGAAVLYSMQHSPKTGIGIVCWEGIKAMLPAIYILVLAWMIGSIIDSLATGEYLADLVQQASLNTAFLPFLIFIVAGFMALATGTSWGTFGIMLPIAAEIAALTDVELVLPAMAAVLAGSVFGDHCSPISDTSILSSTGAGSNHIDHVLTQLPYAFIAAIASVIGYLVLGVTGQTWIALLLTLALVLVTAIYIHNQNNRTSGSNR
ncbi:Na+/H+ antiporter NhaC family protein [Sediminibacillus dalangtanensis]|uniref:Na+/H+ antiporter NhaC family protein n=1 Tax=Sediminibacillus dalangtanensis TaxID=2729421 RepID=A0ABX7VUK8_9BACI|nr:Na+/H+ antiporter NhaC family protein [Sediminibacillus dalangtanensis]QTN00209.1 Na+/H+ antiporter NhaC family protein [Sediminibacillus dalangtanensis]